MARTGKGTRLRSNINIRGDMPYLLFNSVSRVRGVCMPLWSAMRGPEEYLQRWVLQVTDSVYYFIEGP